jgi:hypothetical protein
MYFGAFIALFSRKWLEMLLLIFFVLSNIIAIISETLVYNEMFSRIAFYLLVASLILMFVWALMLLALRKWLKAFCAIFICLITLFGWFVHAAIMFLGDIDRFADNLKIPDDIKIFSVVGYSKIESNVTDFVIYGDAMNGMYQFDFFSGKIEAGSVYLKAFEVTREHQLSTNELLKRSIKVFNPTDDVLEFEGEQFKIYEGNWGQYYAARFELWFKPDDGTGERKIAEKVYKIGGWQR